MAFATDVLTKLHIERIFPLRFENDWVYHFSENPEPPPSPSFPGFGLSTLAIRGPLGA